MKIEIKGFSKKISNHTVLDDININFQSGKVYGLVGKNGSGKTMLMRAICGLVLPTSGTIEIDDKIVGKDISFPQDVGVLIESPGFISSYSGFRNLKVLAQIRKRITDNEIASVLDSVGLDPYDKKSFRKYSLGMKQKLGIAAAIMEDPKLLILDEPFNALDDDSVNRIRKIIQSKKSADRIIILSCHDSEEIDKLCDEIIEIKLGKITSIRQNEGKRNNEKKE